MATVSLAAVRLACARALHAQTHSVMSEHSCAVMVHSGRSVRSLCYQNPHTARLLGPTAHMAASTCFSVSGCAPGS